LVAGYSSDIVLVIVLGKKGSTSGEKDKFKVAKSKAVGGPATRKLLAGLQGKKVQLKTR